LIDLLHLRFIKFLQNGELSFEPTPEAQMKKIYQQAQRQKAKERRDAEKSKS
jgi:hypothetical protein